MGDYGSMSHRIFEAVFHIVPVFRLFTCACDTIDRAVTFPSSVHSGLAYLALVIEFHKQPC